MRRVRLSIALLLAFTCGVAATLAAKKPFDPELKLHAKVKSEAMNEGLLCYPMGGTIDGVTGDHVLLALPFICTEAQIDEIVDKLARAIVSGTHALKHAA